MLPKPASEWFPILMTGGALQSPDRVAAYRDGWMTNPRMLLLRLKPPAITAPVQPRQALVSSPKCSGSMLICWMTIMLSPNPFIGLLIWPALPDVLPS
ncbi:hypothetical protein [Primorskyibacter sp. S87]|uniref:hypothetical protein n=1 Tax=Primorskyibacter sp. S87 TaxID=3415126 RepID=UPI003C7C58BD